MGLLLESVEGLHAEARRESFVIYTDFGRERIELEWSKLPALVDLALALRERAPDVARDSATIHAMGGWCAQGCCR